MSKQTRPWRKGGKQRPDCEPRTRANPPGVYVCACCGERLSGPARLYACPGKADATRRVA